MGSGGPPVGPTHPMGLCGGAPAPNGLGGQTKEACAQGGEGETELGGVHPRLHLPCGRRNPCRRRTLPPLVRPNPPWCVGQGNIPSPSSYIYWRVLRAIPTKLSHVMPSPLD